METETVGIDVIVPVKNGERFIAHCLSSILGQSYPLRNIYVINDHSSDRTVDIVKKIQFANQNIHLVDSSSYGVSEARNTGLRYCKSEFVAMIDSDDVWSPTKIEKQVSKLIEDKSDFAYSAYSYIDENGSPLDQLVFPPRLKGDLFEALLIDKYVLSGSASGILIKRSCLDEVGYFDTRLFIGEDWDMWIRLAKVGKYTFVDEPLTQIRVHNQSAQRKNKNIHEIIFFQHLIIFEKFADQINYPAMFLNEIKFMAGKFIARNFFSPIKFRKVINILRNDHPNLYIQLNTTPFNLYIHSFDVLWGILKYRIKKILGLLDE